MAILSLDNYLAAAKQLVEITRTAARTTVATGWFSLFDLAGAPGAGTLAGSSTTNGVVPSDATTGFPVINAPAGGAQLYLARVIFGCSIACRMAIADVLFKAGAYGFAAGTTTLSAQPSFSARVPDGTDYKGLQIWIEVSTAFTTGTAWQVQVTYTNQDGTAGRSSIITAAMAAAALTLGRRYQLALQAGDSGVQKIESVIVTNGGTAMTAGAFNVLVLRPLWRGRVRVANDGDSHGPDLTGLPEVFGTSAMDLMVCADSTSSGVPEVLMEVAGN